MTYYFTSDLHFGHNKIIEYCNRPWADADAMNQGLVDRWNDTVTDSDVVHVLGDMCWSQPKLYVDWLKQLKGQKFLTPGNHDTVWRKPDGKSARLLQDLGWVIKPRTWVFTLVDFDGPRGAYGGLQSYEVLCSHLPYGGVEPFDGRFADELPEDKGQVLLCGHVHQNWHTQGRQFNVGVDVNDYRPVSEATIIEHMRGELNVPTP